MAEQNVFRFQRQRTYQRSTELRSPSIWYWLIVGRLKPEFNLLGWLLLLWSVLVLMLGLLFELTHLKPRNRLPTGLVREQIWCELKQWPAASIDWLLWSGGAIDAATGWESIWALLTNSSQGAVWSCLELLLRRLMIQLKRTRRRLKQ